MATYWGFEHTNNRSMLRSNRVSMIQLDQETADLIAATRLRDALATYPERSWISVEDAVVDALNDCRIDDATARYVLKHGNRFVLCPSPVFVDALWHAGPNQSCA
jgi:hypothetical protein